MKLKTRKGKITLGDLVKESEAEASGVSAKFRDSAIVALQVTVANRKALRNFGFRWRTGKGIDPRQCRSARVHCEQRLEQEETQQDMIVNGKNKTDRDNPCTSRTDRFGLLYSKVRKNGTAN
jgi:hypothetical protein